MSSPATPTLLPPLPLVSAAEAARAAAEAARAPQRQGRSWMRRHRLDLLLLVILVAIAALVSFTGMTTAPQRIDDEGTYVAQAYAILNYGELAHYTYWYDHPPLGWIQLAGYAALTGAFERWDVAVMVGREASVVATLISAVLLWMLARRAFLSRPAAAAAVLLFSLSPLAVQFHRTVYLDNLAMPWLLLAFLLASERRAQLLAFAGSAIAFGAAVLTKETFLLALPFLAWIMLRNAHRETRRYTLSVAASVLVLIGGSYLMLAVVKGELLSGPGRVSLLDGVRFQLSSRQGSGSITDPGSLLNRTLEEWWRLDPVFIAAGLVAALLALFHRRLRPYGVLLLALTAFMFRPGGYLPVPYIIMLIPIAALVIGGTVDAAFRRLRRGSMPKRRAASRLVAAAVVLAAAGALAFAAQPWTAQLRGLTQLDADRPMRQAQDWLETNVTRDQRLIVDNAMWVDLVRAGWDRDNVVWFYKIDTDPAVRADSPNGWRDSDYIITTDSILSSPGVFPEVSAALENSVTVASFTEGIRTIEIRRIVPGGIAGIDSAQASQTERLADLGAQLDANPDIVMADEDREALRGGRVDEKIVTLLAALAGQGAVEVSSISAIDGEGDRMLRRVAISSFAGEPAVEGDAPSPALAVLAGALSGPFAPEQVDVQGDTLIFTYGLTLPVPSP